MDINEEIRFRVVDEMFTDLSPAGPEMTGEKKNADELDTKRSPYTITVSISRTRLNPKSDQHQISKFLLVISMPIQPLRS